MLVQNIKDGFVNSERALKEYIPAIEKMNERFLDLAQNIVDFAALHADTKLNIESVDLVSLIEDAISHLQGPAQERGLRFDTSFPPQRYFWKLDKARASNAIEALLDNAIKFSPKEGTVHVQLQMSNGEARLTVRDEGSGIPEEELRFVFDGFFRGRNARDGHVEGTGLGLAIVDQTMKLHGGEAKARNHPKGGAEFTLVFPKNPKEGSGRDQG
jgi:signal transduction histidine kinase